MRTLSVTFVAGLLALTLAIDAAAQGEGRRPLGDDEPAPEPGTSTWRPDEPQIQGYGFSFDPTDDVDHTPGARVGVPAPARVKSGAAAAVPQAPASGANTGGVVPTVNGGANAPATAKEPAGDKAATAEDPAKQNAPDVDEPASRAWDHDRRDKRGRQLAVPDDYLDPAWPADGAGSRIPPDQSDSVQNMPLDDEALDKGEREELERYKEALGLYKDPDEFTQDHWGEDPAERTRERDVEEYEDPAEW